MSARVRSLHPLILAAALAACDGSSDPPAGDASVPDGAARDAPCPGTPALAVLEAEPRFAVVLSDYASTAIAMLDAEGALLDERWVDSGTTSPGLVATLSGDVVLPTRQAGDGTLTVIDRYRTDVVTRFCVADGTLVGQVRTHAPAVTSAFSSNPQDVLFRGPHEAWVPRYETSLDGAAPELDRGGDLRRIDPIAMVLAETRVDLGSLGGASFVPDTSAEVLPRPSRVVALGGSRAVVGLDRVSTGFDAAGEGRVAVVDFDGGTVGSLALDGLAGCGHVAPVPGEADRALIACVGFPLTDPEARRATSGLVLVDVDGEGRGSVVASFRPAMHPSADAAVNAAVSLGGTLALAVSLGDDVTGEPDRLVRVDLATAATDRVHESSRAFELGAPAFDPQSGLALAPDAGAGVVVAVLEADGSLSLRDTFPLGLGLGLPPRHVGVLP